MQPDEALDRMLLPLDKLLCDTKIRLLVLPLEKIVLKEEDSAKLASELEASNWRMLWSKAA